ncbi:bZIP transcription factor [Spirosoma taeanense]|uniref:BZIP transcription factor n=1 Tax=Spirosoma taeanense TaxID=2735870 RepID=A0A6M5YGB9_9BACT|nr:bZIP transcription factor [Spirosoma taeanense]
MQTARYNVMLGDSAGANTSVNGNVMIGSKAGYLNQTGVQNTFLGFNTGYNNVGTANTFIGYRSGYGNTTGQFNTFIGVQTGASNTTGSSNYMMGTNAGLNNTTGSGNYFLGDNAGGQNVSGGFNVYLGANAGNGAGVNGDNNVAIGFESGRTNSGGLTNTFIGFRADAAASGLQNASAFGANAKVTVSNAVVLGATDASVGIGTTAPTARLEVASGTNGLSGLKFTNLTSANTSAINSSKFLTVDATGNVILANYVSGARAGAEATASSAEGLWVRTGRTLQSREGDAVIIGTGVGRTPAEYNLFVSKGILTEKVKVAVRNSRDWSDYVFAPDYQLKPLAEVERYVKANQHLPGVPSAEQVVQEGVDMARMDAKLLEKIEELTLYVVQINKKVEQLASENRALKRRLSGKKIGR